MRLRDATLNIAEYQGSIYWLMIRISQFYLKFSQTMF